MGVSEQMWSPRRAPRGRSGHAGPRRARGPVPDAARRTLSVGADGGGHGAGPASSRRRRGHDDPTRCPSRPRRAGAFGDARGPGAPGTV